MRVNISKRLRQREQNSAQVDLDLILQNLMEKRTKRIAKIGLNPQQIKKVNRVRSPHKKTVLRKKKIVFYVRIDKNNNNPKPIKLSPHNKTKNQN